MNYELLNSTDFDTREQERKKLYKILEKTSDNWMDWEKIDFIKNIILDLDCNLTTEIKAL